MYYYILVPKREPHPFWYGFLKWIFQEILSSNPLKEKKPLLGGFFSFTVILLLTFFAWNNTIETVKHIKEVHKMAVKLNEDKKVVEAIKEGLKKKGGYCPCRIQKTEENKCICKEFREQIADPDFEGYCHCMLYYKSKD